MNRRDEICEVVREEKRESKLRFIEIAAQLLTDDELEDLLESRELAPAIERMEMV